MFYSGHEVTHFKEDGIAKGRLIIEPADSYAEGGYSERATL